MTARYKCLECGRRVGQECFDGNTGVCPHCRIIWVATSQISTNLVALIGMDKRYPNWKASPQQAAAARRAATLRRKQARRLAVAQFFEGASSLPERVRRRIEFRRSEDTAPAFGAFHGGMYGDGSKLSLLLHERFTKESEWTVGKATLYGGRYANQPALVVKAGQTDLITPYYRSLGPSDCFTRWSRKDEKLHRTLHKHFDRQYKWGFADADVLVGRYRNAPVVVVESDDKSGLFILEVDLKKMNRQPGFVRTFRTIWSAILDALGY